ncbi:MAG TPA: glycerol-3-phosphate 1-O-acyltransferase PlsY [Candidatus Acidoferrales bacterium]|nr:glycerol-3-phosphate 1-O-acyltransferase PlsY [Candidatus Acidoferrales bacterium]
MNRLWLIPVIAYALGSIPFGLLIVKATKGSDVRKSGSGNIGAANVSRVGGLGAGALTLLLDAAKGYLAVWLAARWSGGSVRWLAVAAVCAVLGHMFSVWLKFRGGKGVATSFGAFIPICGKAVIAAAVLWLVVVIFWRYVSLGSIAAAAAMPILVYLLYAPGHAPASILSAGTMFIALMVIWKHRENIQRLMNGTENRIARKR